MSSGLYSMNKREFDIAFDPKRVKPYGDTMNDGKVQLSFTLPIAADELAKEAAKLYAMKMGLEEPGVVHMADLGVGYSFFVVYGSAGDHFEFPVPFRVFLQCDFAFVHAWCSSSRLNVFPPGGAFS